MHISQNHPELRNGEVWLTNCGSETDYRDIGHATKRRGNVAYDRSGNNISRFGYFPVFVQQSELDAKDIALPADR